MLRLLPNPKSLAVKRFMARYIFYLEVFGFAAVSLVALAIAACFFFKVDDLIRTAGDPVPIKPKEEAIKRKADALVTRVFVQNHQKVRKGDPLVEVVEDPRWISRYLVMRQMQTLLDEFEAPGQAAALAKKRIEEAAKAAREAALAEVKKTGPQLTEAQEEKKEEKGQLPVLPLTGDDAVVYSMTQRRLAAWETHGVKQAPRITLRAPIDGIVVASDDLPFKRVDKDGEILKVVDLNDLHITSKCEGETVADARTGQKVDIRAIIPDYKTGMTFRGDTVPKGRWFWQKERVLSYGLLDAKLKDTIKDAFKDRKITQRNDISFKVTEVTDVEVNTAIDTVPVGNGAARRGSVGKAYAQSSTAGEPASPDKPIPADPPTELELSGKVLEGKHTLKAQIADLPPAVVEKIAADVSKKIEGKVFAAPQEPEKEGGKVPLDTLRVEALRGVSIVAKVKGENTDAKGKTKRLKKEAARTAVRGSGLERQFEAKIQIVNPPQFLKDRILEMLDDGKEVKCRVQVKTGRRPVALLLLRR